MKKVQQCVIITLLLLAFIASGCNQSLNVFFGSIGSKEETVENQMFDRFKNTNGSQIDSLFEGIVDDLSKKDHESLKNKFSAQAVAKSSNMDQMVLAMIDFVEGDFVSYERYGPGTFTSKEGNVYQKEIEASFDLETTTAFYKLALKVCVVDTANPENIGVSALFVTKAETNDTSVFWGNDELKMGIVIIE